MFTVVKGQNATPHLQLVVDVIVTSTANSCLNSLCCLRSGVLDCRCGSFGDTSCFLSRCGSGRWQLLWFGLLSWSINLDLVCTVLGDELGNIGNSASTIV